MIQVETIGEFHVESKDRQWIGRDEKVGDGLSSRFVQPESVGFLEFQKYRQYATMFWLYDSLGFEMELKLRSVITPLWTVSMLKFHNNHMIDFFIYENTSDYIRLNVTFSCVLFRFSLKICPAAFRFMKICPIFVRINQIRIVCSTKSLRKRSRFI